MASEEHSYVLTETAEADLNASGKRFRAASLSANAQSEAHPDKRHGLRRARICDI